MKQNASETPNEIVAKAKRGDREAFGELYELLKTSVWSLVFQTLHDFTLTEEVVGDSFLAMIDQADQLPNDFPAVAAWVRTVAKRRCVDLFRRSKLQRNGIQTLIMQDSPLVASNQNGRTQSSRVDNLLERIETNAEVAAAIERLPSDHQLAIQWRYFDGLSIMEIGQRLGITESATNSLLFRARNKLRSTLSSTQVDTHQPARPAPVDPHGTQPSPPNRSVK